MLMCEYIITWFRSHILYCAIFMFFRTNHSSCPPLPLCVYQIHIFIFSLKFPNVHWLSYSPYMSNTLLIFHSDFLFLALFYLSIHNHPSRPSQLLRISGTSICSRRECSPFGSTFWPWPPWRCHLPWPLARRLIRTCSNTVSWVLLIVVLPVWVKTFYDHWMFYINVSKNIISLLNFIHL